MVPALAKRLGTTPAAFGATLARDYPATSNLLRVWPARLSQKAHGIAAGMQAYAGDWKKADKIPLNRWRGSWSARGSRWRWRRRSRSSRGAGGAVASDPVA